MARNWKSESLGEIVTFRIRKWWLSLDTPNPWQDDLDSAVRAQDAIPVCHHCITPCNVPAPFCPTCGAAIGQYNNVMPYIYIFSVGEVLRSGVGPEAHFTRFRAIAYISIGLIEYGIFVPAYLVRLFLNYRRLKKDQAD